MTALAVQFIDGSTYGQDKQFLPGPFNANRNDRSFVEAYTRNARIHGFTLEQCLELNGEQAPAANGTAPAAPVAAETATENGGGSNGLTLNYDPVRIHFI
jgi:hypothetical protein